MGHFKTPPFLGYHGALELRLPAGVKRTEPSGSGGRA
jgi:hypothetical protein